MISLEFSACLNWPAPPDRQSPLVLADRMAQGRECGQAPFLEPDLDGDRIPDIVIPATRLSGQASGLAICLLGDDSLTTAGYAGPIGAHLDTSYFGTADFWAIHRGSVPQCVTEGPPPELRGDAIFLAKQEKSSVIVYGSNSGKRDSYWQGD